MNTLQHFRPVVHALLEETQARQVLVNDAEARALVASSASAAQLDIAEVSAADLVAGQWPHRADLAVTILHAADHGHASAVIAALRDVYARRVLLFLPPAAFQWKSENLLGLGLTLLANYEIDGQAYQAWSFDIRTYKSVPDWLNPRFWANPENWNKFRW